jgi:hypothetical protein
VSAAGKNNQIQVKEIKMKSKISMILMIMGFTLGGVGSAFGSSSFMTPFNNANGTTYNCGVCHTTATASSSARNQFGADWANASIGNHAYTITTALANLDSDGDGFGNGAEILAKTNPGDATSYPAGTADTTAPTVNTFTIPASAGSLTVSPVSLTASDNVGGSGVNGYLVTTTATAPAATATGWLTTAPTSFSFPAGTTSGAQTLYAWARDAAGNVSTSRSASVTITLPPGADTTPPTVTGFTIPVTSSSLTVSIMLFAATDNAGVTGYLVNESANKPLASATGWSVSVPTGYSFTTSGIKTLYAWAKDAAGNVSNSLSQTVNITAGEVDVEFPEVMEFTLPLTSTSLTVPILAFRAIDNVAPTAYLITPTPAAPSANAAGWSATPPTSYTFTSGGAKMLYGWARDAAGNISESLWDNVEITSRDDEGEND